MDRDGLERVHERFNRALPADMAEYDPGEQGPTAGAIRIDESPETGLESFGRIDRERGPVHRMASYVANQLPHLGTVDVDTDPGAEMDVGSRRFEAIADAGSVADFRASGEVPNIGDVAPENPGGEGLTRSTTSTARGIHTDGLTAPDRGRSWIIGPALLLERPFSILSVIRGEKKNDHELEKNKRYYSGYQQLYHYIDVTERNYSGAEKV
jgi:hypothetical protein